MKNILDKNVILFDICIQVVEILSIHLTNDIGTHSRLFNYIIHPEIDYVRAGESVCVDSGTHNHPEHIVPCAFMIKEVKRLISDGDLTTNEIASLLQKHWKIVTITKKEAKMLDQDLKLKSTMPSGWCFETGDSFARLKTANINIKK